MKKKVFYTLATCFTFYLAAGILLWLLMSQIKAGMP